MKMEVRKAKLWRKVKIGAGIALVISALIALAIILVPQQIQKLAAASTEGRLDDLVVADVQTEIQGIDWDYWLSINSTIVAWITIPDTPIDYPIVQAPADNPQFYLYHDIYNNYNQYGCLYVDADCSIDSLNVVIFGHNMGYLETSMFSTLPKYLDAGYFNDHSTVIIQTPAENRALTVRAASNVNPYGYDKGMAFSNVDGLRLYYGELWNSATVRTPEPNPESLNQLFTLITCNNNGSSRAVIYVG
jgi:SrtB family sortase